jgi:hypothetical protein
MVLLRGFYFRRAGESVEIGLFVEVTQYDGGA